MQFLLNAPDRRYSRALWDSVSVLTPKATLDDNSQNARKRAFAWISDTALQQDFQAYVLSLKTAADLVKDGIDLYTKADLANRRPRSPSPSTWIRRAARPGTIWD